MPGPCRQARTACPMAAELPGTLKGMSRLSEVVMLGWDIETLALLGTQFEDALFTTRNKGAVISGRGGYAGLQPHDRSFSVSARRVNLRFTNSAPLQLARCSGASDDTPDALMAVDHTGTIQHRVQLKTDYDQRVAHSLEIGAEVALASPASVASSENVVPLAAIRSAREKWDRAVSADHLNDFLESRGQLRLRCLPHLGRGRAWRVESRLLPGFLNLLYQGRRNFTRIVCATGLMQVQAGPIEQFSQQDGVLFCQNRTGIFALDMREIGSVWATASPLHWQLEIYDHADQGVAIMAAAPTSCGQDWRNLLMAMPCKS